MFRTPSSTTRGFTLIELLVVISIIGVLASVILASLNSARAKSRDAYRQSSLAQLKVALEMYYNDHLEYPITFASPGVWWGMNANGGTHGVSGATGYIPGLAPTYIPTLPLDPAGITTGWSGFNYRSDASGSMYKIIVHSTGPESFPDVGEAYYDPVRPTWAWMICSSEPACSSW